MDDSIHISRNFVNEWIKYAEERQNDDFLHFFCYFLSINYLFDNYIENNRIPNRGERDSLTRFLTDTLPGLISTGDFSLPDSISELRKPVKVLRPMPSQRLTHLADPRSGNPFVVRFHQFEFMSESEDHVVFDDLKEMSRSISNRDVDRAARWEVVLIFHRIYQVRCNLFHGGKSVANSRDRKLVHESVLVMKKFLQSYLKVFHSESTSDIHFKS